MPRCNSPCGCCSTPSPAPAPPPPRCGTSAARGCTSPAASAAGARKGELHWQPLEHSLVLQVLHNPRYAGAYAFGRGRQRRRAGGVVEWRRVPIGEWTVLLRDAHPRLHRMGSLRGQSTASARQRAGPRRGPSPRAAPRGPGAAAGSCVVRRVRSGHDDPLSRPPRPGRCRTTSASATASGLRAQSASPSPAPASTSRSARCWWN